MSQIEKKWKSLSVECGEMIQFDVLGDETSGGLGFIYEAIYGNDKNILVDLGGQTCRPML